MRLAADGREYARYMLLTPSTEPMPTAAEVEILGAWHPLEYVSWADRGPDGAPLAVRLDGSNVPAVATVWRVLVAGPLAAPGAAVVLPMRRTRTRVRVTSSVESVPRSASAIDVE